MTDTNVTGHGIDFDRSRQLYTWSVFVIHRYVIHIASSYCQDNELITIIKDADNRYTKITKVLNINDDGDKANERYVKLNYWIHDSKIVLDSGLVDGKSGLVDGKYRFFGRGNSSASGIDYVIYNSPWKDHIAHLLHEETHLIWAREVGEAPSILNEGIAVYVESLLCDGYEVMKDNFTRLWMKTFERERGLLRNLMRNAFFWDVYGKIPVYTLGGVLVLYMVNKWGINLLKDIFTGSHYNDDNLANLIEMKTSKSIDELENDITEWISSGS